MAGDNSVQDVPKWKIALAVGTPVAIGIAIAWYYKNKQSEPGDNPEERPRMVDPDRTDVESVLSETSVMTEFVKVNFSIFWRVEDIDSSTFMLMNNPLTNLKWIKLLSNYVNCYKLNFELSSKSFLENSDRCLFNQNRTQ